MFTLREPSALQIAEFISRQRELPFSYAETGASAGEPPAGYTIDRNRIELGRGALVYERSVDALKRWRQFDLGWVTIVPRDATVAVGETVAVKAKACGLWSLNACRVVYVIDECERFGFAYGTLPDHVERGEERFLIEWRPDDSVWYEIVAFSRPQHPLAKIGAPIARRLQKRFARDSLAVMKAVVQG